MNEATKPHSASRLPGSRGSGSLLHRLFYCAALLAVVAVLPSSAQVQPARPKGRELHGTITITVSGQATWKEDGDDETYSFVVNRTARHRVKINSTEMNPGSPDGVASYLGSEVEFSATVHDISRYGDREPTVWKGSNQGSCPGGRDFTMGEAICAEGMVALMVSPKARLYTISFQALSVDTGADHGHMDIPLPAMNLGPFELPKDPNARLTGSKTYDAWKHDEEDDVFQSWGFTANLPEQVKAKAVVTWDLGPPELMEVVLEANQYKNWTPTGDFNNPAKEGNSITFTAKVRDRANPDKPSEKRARLTFQLENISTEKGVCLNAPVEGGKSDYDLQILKTMNPKLDVVGPDEARTFNEVSEASLTVSSFDYGAYAQLRVTAETSSGKLPVRFEGREISLLSLPRTYEGERTAAAWLEEHDLGGSADRSDEEQAAGQVEKGDGLSIYEKYRGMVVLEGGGPVFQRLDPKRKTHFVLDDKNVVDPAQWKKTTDTVLYKLAPSLVKDRRANPNSGYGSAGNRYAVMVEVISGMTDPYSGRVDKNQLGYTTYRNYESRKPGSVERCAVFPDRVRANIERIAENIRKGLDEPNSDLGRMILQAGFSIEEARDLYAMITPERKAILARRMIDLVAQHETMHSCNVPGHGPIPPFGEEWEETVNLVDEGCVMQYLSSRTWRRFVLAGELEGEGKLCPLCQSGFSVKE